MIFELRYFYFRHIIIIYNKINVTNYCSKIKKKRFTNTDEKNFSRYRLKEIYGSDISLLKTEQRIAETRDQLEKIHDKMDKC